MKFVVTWNYHDNSSFGVVAVRDTQGEADALVVLLQSVSDSKVFKSHEVPDTKL